MQPDPDRDISEAPTVTVRLAYWREAMLAVACPVCGFGVGEPCSFHPGTMHLARFNEWMRPTVTKKGA